MADEITIYWAPGSFNSFSLSSDLLYSEPISILDKLLKSKTSGAGIAMCPATRGLLSNTFALQSNIDDEFEINSAAFSELNTSLGESKIFFSQPRETSFPEHINVTYNMSWLFFASEPVEMKLIAPYFPAKGICDGSLFSPGSFDIGKWYRQTNLDWHIPESTELISIKEDQELAYLEFKTDKKIKFQRYVVSPRLSAIADELSKSHIKYGKRWAMGKKYDLAKKSGIRELVLSEIKKNLVVE